MNPLDAATCRSAVLATCILSACSSRVPENARYLSVDGATSIRYDLAAGSVAVPWPNDSLCWVDDGESVPCRPNLSVKGATPRVAEWIGAINESRGWPLVGPLVIPFARATDAKPGPAIDLSRLLAAQQDADFANDAIYVIDLTTGIPQSLDFPKTHGNHLLRTAIALDPSDPRRQEPSLVVETVDERYDTNTSTFVSSRTENGQPDGIPRYSTEWDTDSDGITDIPATLPGNNCLEAQLTSADQERFRVLRDRCLADSISETFDAGRDTLRLYPRASLEEGREYAVVITDRLLDNAGRPITSPFPDAVHPRQRATLDRLMFWIRNQSHQQYFGDLSKGERRVRVAWSFTTGTPIRDLSRLANRLQPALNASSPPENAQISLDRYFDLDAPCPSGSPRAALASLLTLSLGLSATQQLAIVDALTSVGAVVTGSYVHPPYVIDQRAASNLEPSNVPVWITVPKGKSATSPMRTLILNQERGTSHLEALRWGGQWASLGLATLGFERSGSHIELPAALIAQLEDTFATSCSGELLHSLLATRQDTRVVVGSAQTDVDPSVLVTRNRWRTDAVELATLVRVLGAPVEFGFDSPSLQFAPSALVGIGTGAAPLTLAASLLDTKPSLVLIDPVTSPERAWRRGATWGSPNLELWRIFGPRIAGVPSTDLAPNETHCLPTDTSVRVVSHDAPNPGNELGCIALRNEDGARFPTGATVVATNLSTLARRCVKMTYRGEFSLGIPADSGNELEISVYATPNLLERFGRDQDCGTPEQLSTPDVVLGGTAAVDDDTAARITIGTGGLGLERQSSEVLDAIDYASAAFSPANPRPFLAALAEPRLPTDSNGILIVLSPGDPAVPSDEGLSLANAARLIPRFPASNLDTYRELAPDTTPSELANALRKPTAAERVEWAHLDEGVPRLQRFPPDASSCAPNVTVEPSLESLCHPACAEDAQCAPNMRCLDGKCQVIVPSEQQCSESLPDVDALADKMSPFGTIQPVPYLRLARYAGHLDADNLSALWQPQFRITGPLVQPTHPDWPLIALSIPLADPWGNHGIVRDDWCHKFRFGDYVPYMIGQFVATGGTAYAPVTNRDAQTCLAAPKTLPHCDFLSLEQQ